MNPSKSAHSVIKNLRMAATLIQVSIEDFKNDERSWKLGLTKRLRDIHAELLAEIEKLRELGYQDS